MKKIKRVNSISPAQTPSQCTTHRLLIRHLPRLHVSLAALPLLLMEVDLVRVLDDADARAAAVIAALLQVVLLLDRIALVAA